MQILWCQNVKEISWYNHQKHHELKIFSNDLLKLNGVIKTSNKCYDWVATDVNVTVVEDDHRPIIGRDLFSKLGFSLTQTKQVECRTKPMFDQETDSI